MLKQGKPPQFKERVRVLPAGIGDVEKNEIERGSCGSGAKICGEIIAGEAAEAGIGSELVETLNPFEAAAVKLPPDVKLPMTITTLDAAAMLPASIRIKSEEVAPGDETDKLISTAWLTATITRLEDGTEKKLAGKAKVILLLADNAPPMVVSNDIVTEILA
jgi:hypothetical protein